MTWPEAAVAITVIIAFCFVMFLMAKDGRIRSRQERRKLEREVNDFGKIFFKTLEMYREPRT